MGLVSNLRSYLWIPIAQNSYRWAGSLLRVCLQVVVAVSVQLPWDPHRLMGFWAAMLLVVCRLHRWWLLCVGGYVQGATGVVLQRAGRKAG